MRISVITTLQGPISIEIDGDDTVGALREKIGTFGRFQGIQVAQIRIVKNGEYLDNDLATLDAVGIGDGTNVVAFVSKYGVLEDPLDKVETNVLQPVIDSAGLVRSRQLRSGAKPPHQAQSIFVAPPEPIGRFEEGKNINKSPETSISEPTTQLDKEGEKMESSNVEALVGMGFDKAVAEAALELCDNDVSSAVEFIVSNGAADNEELLSLRAGHSKAKRQVTPKVKSTRTTQIPAQQIPNSNSPSVVTSSVTSNQIIGHPLAQTLTDTEKKSIYTISALTGVPTTHVCSVFFASGRNADSCCEMLMKDVEEMGSCGQMKNVVHFDSIGSIIEYDDDACGGVAPASTQPATEAHPHHEVDETNNNSNSVDSLTAPATHGAEDVAQSDTASATGDSAHDVK